MPAVIPEDSVGLVTPQTLHFDQPLALSCGRSLAQWDLMVETYGELNADASNAVLICHALSGHHHAAGYHDMSERKPGWWDSAIGPGKAIDTNRFLLSASTTWVAVTAQPAPTALTPTPANPTAPTSRS